MERDTFIALLSKKLSQEISEADQTLLNDALQNNEEYQQLALQLARYFNEKPKENRPNKSLDQIWAMIAEAEKGSVANQFNYRVKKQPILSTTLLKIAAVLVLVLGAGWLSYHWLNRSDKDFEAIAATDQKVFKVLADGTRIWLNKQTTITYNPDFGKHQREIFLNGEAYFDVVKNSAVPLFIHAGDIDIEVKGTAFNVNADQATHQVQVALVRGAIAVTDRKNTAHSVLLKPNEKLVFNPKTIIQSESNFKVTAIKPNVLNREISWTTDTVIFNKERLGDLALRLEKKYDVKIDIKSEVLKEKRFSGTFTNQTIQQALDALKLSYPFTYSINNRLVVIKD
jgi:ferric-dicitrate binding protein FerR (iron transport regulator)